MNNKKTLYAILKILGLVLVIFILIVTPFVIEAIIYDETTFPFNLQIKSSREVWFSFVGSYFGAIGTVLLGVLALWQTKKYKKASDEADETSQILQEKIRELVQANTDLAKENKNIQERINVIDAKIKALSMYRGVMRPYPHPRSAEYIYGLAAVRGSQWGVNYAEAFEVVLRTY